MKIIDLAGKWYLKEKNHNEIIEGKLPGCNFLDLMKNNKIKDVFVGKNELEASWVGERDWEYYRDYDISQSLLQNEFVFLKISKPDTICDIFINDKLVAKAKNSHLDYEFDIKEYLKVGKNSIRILFYSPIKYIEKKQNQDKFPYNHMGINGFAHIRKAAYHFGWDWGPVLPPSGVNGDIKIVAFQKAYIKDVDISQRHFDNKVNLEIKSFIVSRLKDVELVLCVKIYDPQEGLIYEKKGDKYAYNFVVENPKLWQPNGYIKRDVEPLYKIDVSLSDNKGIVQDNKSYKIGLRTIELDTSKDSFGNQFTFIVNKIRIFAKGGNWIPSDSFITRVSDDKLEKLIKSCKSANMNMIRVWGGGFYESDFFYELCDKYGILVWQDFMFACHPYPFYEGDFLQSVKDEIAFNVKRLKH
ncbi:MAG: glycoside hydrolase family 2 protein, partial [Bacillota bacterium]